MPHAFGKLVRLPFCMSELVFNVLLQGRMKYQAVGGPLVLQDDRQDTIALNDALLVVKIELETKAKHEESDIK